MSNLPRNLTIAATAWILTTAAFSQPFSFQSDTTKTPTTHTPAPPLTPDNFKNSVTQKSKQAQQDLYKQAQDNLKQQSSQMPLPNVKPVAPKLNPQQSAPTTTTPTTTEKEKTSLPSDDSTDEVAATPAPLPATPAQIQPNTTPSPVAAAPVEAAPAPTQSQTYTGFGAATQPAAPSTAPKNSGSQSNSGWNIKY